MVSSSSTSLRCAPLQARASRRVAQFLEAAEALIAEVGYEALTMTAVAERAGASIGALYRWFPDKVSLAQALRTQYAEAIESHWEPLIQNARSLSLPEFSEVLIDRMVDFTRERPAYLPLIAAPITFTRDPAARKNLRDKFAEALRIYAPGLSPEQAFLTANVVLQIIKGLINTFGQATEEERAGLTREFKRVLTLYLSEALSDSPERTP